MKFKKSIIIALFLCLLMIGSSHAASDNDTTVSSTDITSDSISQTDDAAVNQVNGIEDNINKNDEKPIKEEPSGTSFKALNKTIKATDSEIELDNDYIHDESSDSEFRDGITISKSITINGKNKLLMQSVKPEYKFGRINFLPQRSFFFLYIH